MSGIHYLAKKHLSKVTPYIPGKPIEDVVREYGIGNEVIKLASNENLFGPSPKALEAIKKIAGEINLYPDDSAFYLRKKLAQKYDLKEEELFIGNGSIEIIYYLAWAFAGENDSIAFCHGSFPMYRIVTEIVGAEPITPPLKKNKAVDPIALLHSIKPNTKIVFLSNPNNPTGTSFSSKEELELVENAPPQTLLVFDEAYSEFIETEDFPDTLKLLREKENIVILRTFSKAAGLAGLRVGYAIAKEGIINALMKVRIPFNVNRVAQICALYAMDDDEHINKTVQLIKGEKKFLYREFEQLNLFYLPSDTNFIYVEFQEQGNVIYEKLLKKGIITRPLGPIFPNALRITVGTHAQNIKLIDTLKEILYT